MDKSKICSLRDLAEDVYRELNDLGNVLDMMYFGAISNNNVGGNEIEASCIRIAHQYIAVIKTKYADELLRKANQLIEEN